MTANDPDATEAVTARHDKPEHDTPEHGNHKWILEIAEGDLARDVAGKTIRLRLQAVGYFLPLAAKESEKDIEYVHQLRVSTRRAVAAVEMYRDFLPNRARKKLCRQLKRIRRAAGTARDCDVMIERHEQAADTRRRREFLNEMEEKRREAQKPLRAVHRSSIKKGKLEKLAYSVLDTRRHRKSGKKPPRFDRWARRQLRSCARSFFHAEPDHLDDLEALHQFRLRGKDLRYAIELLAAAFPDTLRLELYPLIEQLQDRLGAINDHAVAIERFQEWRTDADRTNDRRRSKRYKKMIKSERKLLAESQWEFARWWTPRRSKRIQSHFRKLVNGKQ